MAKKKKTEIQLRIPDLSKGEKVQLSYSKLSLFQSCPREYYYRYLRADIKEKPTVWPGNLIGQVFHKVVQKTIESRNKGKKDTLIIAETKGKFHELYENEVEKHKDDYKKSKEIAMAKDKFWAKNDKLMLSLAKFILAYFYIDDGAKIIPEEEFNVLWKWDEEILIRGFLDIHQYNNKIKYHRIYDLKVTKDSNNYYFVDWDNAYQKMVYEYFLYSNYETLPELFCYLVLNREEKSLFFKEKRRISEFTVETYFSKLHNELQKVKKYTLNPDLSLANPKEKKCKWCAYNSICDKKYISKYVKAVRKKKK